MSHTAWPEVQIDVKGARIYVEKHGEGPPLICLHNFSANSRSRFKEQLPLLTQHFTCYLMDLRAHGRSSNECGEWSHELVSRDIIQVAEGLGISQARFLAASSGAMAMLRVARYAPELVHAMVLDSATYRIPVEARKFYRHPDSLSPRLKEYYRNANEVYGPEFGPKLAHIFYDFRLPECDINQPLELLREISSPTLFVAGDRDFFFPVDIPIAMKLTVPGSQLSIFPNTSHIVMETYPIDVANLAINFLAEH